MFDVKRTAYIGVLAALTIIFSYIEVLIPFSIGIPGAKLGIANLGIIISLYYLGARDAFIVNFIRIFILALLFGNIYTFAFSISGGLFSLGIMAICKKIFPLGIVTVSTLGGISHNLAQLMAAYMIIGSRSLIYYLVPLIIAGTITGATIGIVSVIILKTLKKRMVFK